MPTPDPSPADIGFPEAALDFYDDLEVDNTKSFWEAHKEQYQSAVRAPMQALCDALEKEFGTAKLFRPYRDVRFAKDKTPYKTHQGAFIAHGPATGWYVELSAPGLRVAGGFYHAEPDALARVRAAMADDRTGAQVQRMVRKLERAGFDRWGDRLKTSPRGYDGDHPRIDLLRYRSLALSRSYGFDPVIHSPDLLEKVRADFKALRPLVDWLTQRTR